MIFFKFKFKTDFTTSKKEAIVNGEYYTFKKDRWYDFELIANNSAYKSLQQNGIIFLENPWKIIQFIQNMN